MKLTRRAFARWSGLSLLGASASGWLPQLAAHAAASKKPHKRCLLLWMSGGPSQQETFDPKPDHDNGGPTESIETSVPGIQISQHLPQVAKLMDHLAIIRTMSTKEGDHTRATYYLRTGYLPQGPIQYPSIGSLLGRSLRDDACDLPSYVSVNPFRAFSPAAYGPGFLGPAWSPLIVNAEAAENEPVSFAVSNLNLRSDVTEEQADARLKLLSVLEHEFTRRRPGGPAESHVRSYEQAVRMMKSAAVGAFNLDDEDDVLRDAYGRNPFGQGCLLARRLLESGVSFVEVNLSDANGNGNGAGWDTHADNFESVGNLCGVLDPAWATLMTDLDQRGLLEDTLIIWMGEFGRTPVINDNAGRDHWPNSWSIVLGGGGIQGGQVYGQTADDGIEIVEHPLTVPDLMATVFEALELDPAATNDSNIGRPIPFADHDATSVEALLASR